MLFKKSAKPTKLCRILILHKVIQFLTSHHPCSYANQTKWLINTCIHIPRWTSELCLFSFQGSMKSFILCLLENCWLHSGVGEERNHLQAGNSATGHWLAGKHPFSPSIQEEVLCHMWQWALNGQFSYPVSNEGYTYGNCLLSATRELFKWKLEVIVSSHTGTWNSGSLFALHSCS